MGTSVLAMVLIVSLLVRTLRAATILTVLIYGLFVMNAIGPPFRIFYIYNSLLRLPECN
jgi:NhaP-type Na+/H+ or K+/H+ antiporter